MLFEIWRGEICETVDLADVVFCVFTPDRGIPEYQHVALCYQSGPLRVGSNHNRVHVLEVDHFAQASTWPSKDYRVDLVGQMVRRNRPIDDATRMRIVKVAEKIAWPKRNLIDVLGRPRKVCSWGKSPYKFVYPNPARPQDATKMRFTCATFVEFCYESAGVDIVNDGVNGEHLPVVDWDGEQLPRLFTGYMIKAFQDTTVPLDVKALETAGAPAHRFQQYPFS